MDFLTLFLVILGGFVAGIVFSSVFRWFVARSARSITARQYREKGLEMKESQENRLMAFLTEVKAAHDEWKAAGGTDIKEFGLKKLPSIGVRYLDVISHQGKQLIKLLNKDGGGLGGLEEFL